MYENNRNLAAYPLSTHVGCSYCYRQETSNPNVSFTLHGHRFISFRVNVSTNDLFFDFNKEIKPFLTGIIVLIILYTLFWLVLGELVFNAGLSRLSPTVAALLMFTLPLFTAVISAFVFKEPLTLRLIIGAILIISGVLVISK